ncbi:unnamed protein product, partial [Polarella glacialis]
MQRCLARTAARHSSSGSRWSLCRWKALTPLSEAEFGRLPAAPRRSLCASSSSVAPVEEPKVLRRAEAAAEADGTEIDAEGDIPPEVSELFDTLRGEAMRRLDEFGPIHLFSLCWAYSTARLLDDDLQRRITRAALRLGEKRDAARSGDSRSGGKAVSFSDAEKAGSAEGPEDSSQKGPEGAMRAEPYIAQESDHWLALFKPPNWTVSVDSKEATKQAAVTPFEDDEEADADE